MRLDEYPVNRSGNPAEADVGTSLLPQPDKRSVDSDVQ